MTSLKKYISKKHNGRLAYGFIILLVLVFLSIQVNFDPIRLYRGIPSMYDLFRRILRPNLSYVGEVFEKLLETIEIAIISTMAGVLLAVPFSLLVAENIAPNKYLASILRAIFAFIRTIPSLVWAAILVSIFSIGKFSGIIALGIIAFSMALKLLVDYIEDIEENQLNSTRSVGADSIQVLRYCILPQVFELTISIFFTVFETNIRSATILGLVGAGGIGQIMWRDLNHLRYDNLSTLILILFSSILLIDILSLYIRRALNKSFIEFKSLEGHKKFKTIKAVFGPVIIMGLIILVFKSFNISIDRFLLGIEQGRTMLLRMLRMDFSYFPKLIEGVGESFFIAMFATVLGGILGLVFSYFTAYNTSPRPWISMIFKGIINIFRTFPPIITAIIFFRGVGPGPLAGALALTIYTTGTLTKLYSEVLENTGENVKNSILSTGATDFQAFRHGLFPQTFATFISLTLYRLESNIRNSTILGVIGAGGIGTILSMNITWRNWEQVGLLLMGISLMIIFIDKISNYLRRIFS